VSTDVSDNPTADRYEVHVDGALAGFADRHQRGEVLTLPHTVVDPQFQGRGLAALLVRRALDDARRLGLTVAPTCSYVASYISEHPDDLDLVPEAERPRYGL